MRTSAPVGLLAVGIVVAAAAALSAQLESQPYLPAEIEKVASVADLRARTASERIRAAWYDEQRSLLRDMGMKLGDFAKSGRIVDPGVCQCVGTLGPPPSAEELLRQRVCSSDVVLVGRVASRRTLMTTSEGWLFTDYAVAVESVFRGQIENGANVVVSRRGGMVQIGQDPLTNIEGAGIDRPFRVDGRYLMHLRWDKGADAFSLLGEPEKLWPLPGLSAYEPAYLAKFQKAAQSCPKRK